ncbi:hypothetical protein PspLS_11559 [Pyricularia sp. CBS 133598]|nr:hypothetical protein PspLS_11559 [Pyricularia sp. CBS 133598]
MKFSIISTLMALAVLSSAAPVEETNSTTLLVPVRVDEDGTEGANSLAMAGCIVRAWDGDRCNGRNLYAYEYSVVRNSCRSCVNYRGSHSYSFEGSCLGYQVMYANHKQCGDGMGDLAGGGPAFQCYNVNTGHEWNTGTLCFGPR